MTETLSMLAGALLSIAVGIIPGLKQWFEKLDATKKRLVMAGAITVVALAIFGLACVKWLESLLPGTGLVCDEASAQILVKAWLFTLVGNQGIYTLFFKESSKNVVE